ncbi:amidophosphoribosyltransferase [Acuticoccus sp.]|uniref:amidophosphoribosyltransferase n=1 Tax=Acuticoccus sp. TaxID=1904378 RepID=UPI003B517C2E
MPRRLIDARFSSEDDHFHDECGVFGVFRNAGASALTALGLHALQHRGQEAAGIVSCDRGSFRIERHMGLVGDNFTSQDVIARLRGDCAIGHNRYSTTGEPALHNVQPLFAETAMGGFAVAHNGNITNARKVREALRSSGSIFQSTSDTEVLIHLLATSAKATFIERFVDAIRQLEGAFALVAMTAQMMIGCRDALGIRPLVIGDYEGSFVFASETCALDIIGARFVRDVEPGELVIVSDRGLESLRPFPDRPDRFCVFEYVYFARPDSTVGGRNVYDVRKAIGRELAREAPALADVVVPVPDSGTPAAIGFAEGSNLPFDLGIIRNHYVGRTFIEPSDQIRHMGVKLKHNANRNILAGKRVALVDDSIVRGTTSLKIVEMVREAGAAEVHMRIASPPTTDSCFYGVDTPEKSKLIAARMSVEELARYIRVDSLAYLSIDGLYRAAGADGRDAVAPRYCDACFTGEYPTPLTDREMHEPHAQLSFLEKA